MYWLPTSNDTTAFWRHARRLHSTNGLTGGYVPSVHLRPSNVELLYSVAGQGRLVPAFLVAGTVADRLPSFVL